MPPKINPNDIQWDAAPPPAPPVKIDPGQVQWDATPAMPTAMTEGEELASSIPSRFIAGMTGPAKVLLKLVGPDSIKKQIADVDAMRQRGMEKRGTGFDWAGLLGSMVPGGLISKGVNAALPVTTALGRVGQGAVTGAATAAAQPLAGKDELSTDKLGQIGVGAVAGGAIPAVVETGKAIASGVSKVIEPLTEGGRDKILKRFLQKIVPEPTQTAVRQATANAPEYVPGSKPTVGEAVASIPQATALAKHQDIVSRLPNVSGQFATREAAQEGARKAAIGTVAKTPQDMANQQFVTRSNADQFYEAAKKELVPIDKDLRKLLQRPSVREAMAQAHKIAKEEGKGIKLASVDPKLAVGDVSVRDLHYIKMGLDKILEDPAEYGLKAVGSKNINDTREALLRWMDDKSNAYKFARETFAADKQVEDRMKIGKKLAETLTSSLGTSERALPFANAVQNEAKTLKSSTGRKMYDKLADVMTPQELRSIEGVGKDLARKDEFTRLARQTNMGAADAIPGQVEHRLPNLLNVYAAAANKAMGLIGKSAEEKIAARAGGLYLDPKEFSKFIGPDVPPRYRPLLEEMMRQSAGAAGTVVGRNY